MSSREHISIVVLGASGDLAKKKTFPALFGLYKNKYMPESFSIVGYARTELSTTDFASRITSKIKAEKALIESFSAKCSYISGQYEHGPDFQKLSDALTELESGFDKRHRIFYLALPPSVFIPVSDNLKVHAYSKNGWNRLIVEKPFGRDFDSSKELSHALGKHWTEEEIYRIDHYLGKEMVKNLIILRFANIFMGAIWNRHYIDNVQITFKEPFGTEGRGGYFDNIGIIRDVMQNHLLQILSIIGMEKPVTLGAKDVRDEKYTASPDGSKPGYLDDESVPKNSRCETFAAAVLRIHNERWEGVPFILKCGKALVEQKAEIRIQFRDVPGNIFPHDVSRNELVIRVQPEEAVYIKLMNKVPGLGLEPHVSELDMSYKTRYTESRIPEAYESLILDVFRGDQSNFVRADELDAAWRIFTPLLHKIESSDIKPALYPYGSRGPPELDEWIRKHGFVRGRGYQWKAPTLSNPSSPVHSGKL